MLLQQLLSSKILSNTTFTLRLVAIQDILQFSLKGELQSQTVLTSTQNNKNRLHLFLWRERAKKKEEERKNKVQGEAETGREVERNWFPRTMKSRLGVILHFPVLCQHQKHVLQTMMHLEIKPQVVPISLVEEQAKNVNHATINTTLQCQLFMRNTCTSCLQQHRLLSSQLGAMPGGATLSQNQTNFHWHQHLDFQHLNRHPNIFRGNIQNDKLMEKEGGKIRKSKMIIKKVTSYTSLKAITSSDNTSYTTAQRS